jgi:hypothetical protein
VAVAGSGEAEEGLALTRHVHCTSTIAIVAVVDAVAEVVQDSMEVTFFDDLQHAAQTTMMLCVLVILSDDAHTTHDAQIETHARFAHMIAELGQYVLECVAGRVICLADCVCDAG